MNEKLKKILSGVGVLAAFGLGGAAIAGGQGNNPIDKAASAQTAPAQSESGEQSEGKEQGDANETERKVTGANADRAGQAALRAVGEGKVLSVEKEKPEQSAEKPEPGEKPDPAQEQAIDQKTAYSVEVQKSGGTTVDVALDDRFNVLGSEQDNEQDTESSSEPAAEAPAQR